MVFRILAVIILLFSVLFMPFWVSAILTLGGIIYFRYFFEGAFMMLLSDTLFGVPEAHYYNMVFISTIAAIILISVAEFTKSKLRFYH